MRTSGLDLTKMGKNISNALEMDTTGYSSEGGPIHQQRGDTGPINPYLATATDVEGYLSLERDKTIVDALEETRSEVYDLIHFIMLVVNHM